MAKENTPKVDPPEKDAPESVQSELAKLVGEFDKRQQHKTVRALRVLVSMLDTPEGKAACKGVNPGSARETLQALKAACSARDLPHIGAAAHSVLHIAPPSVLIELQRNAAIRAAG